MAHAAGAVVYDGAVGDGSERRKYPRVPLTADAPIIHLSVDLSVGEQRASAQVINIAEEGLFLATDAPIERSVQVELEFVVAEQTCTGAGMVVWKTDRGIGIRLTTASEDYRQWVRELAAASLDDRWEMLKAVDRADIRAV